MIETECSYLTNNVANIRKALIRSKQAFVQIIVEPINNNCFKSYVKVGGTTFLWPLLHKSEKEAQEKLLNFVNNPKITINLSHNQHTKLL